MLGDKLGEGKGKVIGTRILPSADGRMVKMEITFQSQGKLLGMDSQNMGSYTVYERIPGQLYGEGQGIVMTSDGESAIWHGFGVGQMTGKGMGVRWSACVNYQAKAGKLGRLNNVLGVVEHETDEQQNSTEKVWEWK